MKQINTIIILMNTVIVNEYTEHDARYTEEVDLQQ